MSDLVKAILGISIVALVFVAIIGLCFKCFCSDGDKDETILRIQKVVTNHVDIVHRHVYTPSIPRARRYK